jgi:formylglycine-generating enzyme required for sulfatase activity
MNGEPSDNPDRTRVRFPPTPGVAAPPTPTTPGSLDQTVPLAVTAQSLPADLPAQADAPAGQISAEVMYGTVLSGRYRIEEKLGSGGMAVVYAATDLQMPGVRVAIKLLQPELREQPALLKMLRESVRKVRALPHPHIASVYSVEADGPNDFVIMELLQGQTLKQLLDHEYARGLPLAMARTLISDVCSALAYAHDHGVIHCDIKPSNIFVTPAGRAKLFDFDIARVVRGPVGYFDARSIEAFTGAYASVEIAEGGAPDPRDDVFSLACVIYEMLSGWHPYGGAGARAARDKRLTAKPLPSLPNRANRALLQALSVNRDERLASVEALQKAFAGESLWSTVRSRPLAWAGIAVGALLSVTLIAWLLSADETSRRLDASVAAAPALATDAERASRRAQTVPAGPTPQVAQLGTTEPQLLQALDLCRQLGYSSLRCSPKDLADEAPRTVSLQPFTIDAAPVTTGDFARFASATGHRTMAEKDGLLYTINPARGWNEVRRNQSWRTLRSAALARGEAADALPVLGMDLESARAYCVWKGQRLPTEDEWEYSARGREARIFPWGDAAQPPQPLPKRVVTQSSGFGGNVAEWTESHTKGERVLRGGSWLLPQSFFQRLALRRIGPPGAALDSSFRCAASAGSWPGDRVN